MYTHINNTTFNENLESSIISKKMVFLISAVLFLACFIPMASSGYTFYTEDTVGYFGIAASVSGNNWKEFLSNINTYSYGYALLLVPILYLFKGTSYVLIGAALINSLLFCILFLIILFCSLKIIKKPKRALLYSIVFTCYSGYISAAQNYIADLLVIVLFWLVMAIIIKVVESVSVLRLTLLAFFCSLIYASHQRCIAVVAAVVLVVFFMFMNKEITKKQLLVFGLLLFIMLLAAKCGYDKTTQFFASALDFDGNSASVRLNWAVQETFTLKGIWRIVRNFLGQVYYIFVATLGFFPIGIGAACLALVKGSHKEKIKIQKGSILDYIYLLLILSFLFELGIVCISINIEYVTHLMFGRYIEFLAMPAALVLTSILERKIISLKEFRYLFYCISGIVIISGTLITFIASTLEDKRLIGAPSSIGIIWIGEAGISWFFGGIICIFISAYIFNLLLIPQNRWKYALAILFVYFLMSTIVPYKYVIRPEWQNYEKDINEFTETVKENKINTIYWPYYSQTSLMKRLQVLLPDVVFKYYDLSLKDGDDIEDKEKPNYSEILRKIDDEVIAYVPMSNFKRCIIQEPLISRFEKIQFHTFGGLILLS